MKRKKIKYLIVSLMVSFSLLGNSVVVQAYDDNKLNVINQNVTKEIEDTLKKFTSDEFRGRLPGDEGNYKTIDYIENKFKKIGLEKYTDDSYFHSYEQMVFKPKYGQYFLEIEFADGKKKEYKYSEDFLDRAKFENFDLNANITFDPEDNNLADKILVSDKYIVTKVRPKALLYVKNNFMQYGNIATSKSVMCIQITKKLYDDLRSAEKASIKVSNRIESTKLNNVIGKISGKNNKNVLVLSAHFDHVGYAGQKIFRGAVDNASGTSVLLELAQKLKEQSNKKRFDMDILICAFNGEDSGPFTSGGRAFVDNIKDKYDTIYDINLDTLGKKDGDDLVIDGDKDISKELFEDLSKYAERYNIKHKAGDYGLGSDHWSFIEKNIPGVNIGQENVYQVGTGIHTVNDTTDNMDIEYLGKIVDMVYDFIIENNGKIYMKQKIQ